MAEFSKEWRVLHRVPPHVRENKKDIFDPTVLALGPYHDHSHPRFHQVEQLKDEILDTFMRDVDKGLFRNKILDRMDELRNFYGGVSMYEYDDDALAEMMLRDACFALYNMAMTASDNKEMYDKIIGRLGRSGVAVLYRDFPKLENQIPFWVIRLIISLKFDDKDQGKALVYNFLSLVKFGDTRLTRVPWRDQEQEPLHLLEAQRTTLVTFSESGANTCTTTTIEQPIIKVLRRRILGYSSPFRSVTDLKAKGIQFGPSSDCLKDIRFRSYSFHGKLQLPILLTSKVFFSNLVAMEMSPEAQTDYAVTSYVNFMKTLLENSKDVQELRENGILFSSLTNDEEVVKMFKQIDTYGQDNEDIFNDVKIKINKHCGSRSKTWMAELIYTYFRSPWTATALFAAAFLLCLTFLQTSAPNIRLSCCCCWFWYMLFMGVFMKIKC